MLTYGDLEKTKEQYDALCVEFTAMAKNNQPAEALAVIHDRISRYELVLFPYIARYLGDNARHEKARPPT